MNKSAKSKKNNGIFAELRRFYPNHEEGTLATAMLEALGGGKCLRAIILLECHQLCGGKENDRSALAAAAAVEMIHAYSLVHDDLPPMDDADTRRGKPSCHKKYGEATAILVGDGLLTLGFETLAEAGLGSQVASLARAAGYRGMIEGQFRDLEVRDLEVRDLEVKDLEAGELAGENPGDDNAGDETAELLSLYALKTAALFSWAARTGAELAGSPMAEEFGEFGNRFGLLFQLADDVADGQLSKTAASTHLEPLKTALFEFIAAPVSSPASPAATKAPSRADRLKPLLDRVLETFRQ